MHLQNTVCVETYMHLQNTVCVESQNAIGLVSQNAMGQCTYTRQRIVPIYTYAQQRIPTTSLTHHPPNHDREGGGCGHRHPNETCFAHDDHEGAGSGRGAARVNGLPCLDFSV